MLLLCSSINVNWNLFSVFQI